MSKINFFNMKLNYFPPKTNVGVFLAFLCLTCIQHNKVSYELNIRIYAITVL